MSKWLKRMKDIFFESEQESAYEREFDRNPDAPSNSKGRIEDSKRTIKPRFVQQYPKEGNFRFPLIPDEERHDNDTYNQVRNNRSRNPDTAQAERREDNDSTPSKRERKKRDREVRRTVDGPREKFTGVDFKPSDIPSPIYGFGKRPEVFPPIYGEPIEQNEEYPDHETLGIESDPEPFPLISDLRKQESTSTPAESDEVEDQGMERQAESSAHQQYDNREPTAPDQSEYEPDPLKEASGEMGSKVESSPNTKYEETEENDDEELAEPMEQVQERTETSRRVHNPESRHTTRQSRREPEASTRTSHEDRHSDQSERKRVRVPFNVMMLQKDRQQKRQQRPTASKQEHHRTERQNGYRFPSVSLLDSQPVQVENDELWLQEQKEMLQSTLNNFNVKAHVIGATKGPSVTRIEVQPAPGVKVNKITNLSDDIKLSLAAKDIRIEAPIPGRNAIGIEVPNKVSKPVTIREIVTHPEFRDSRSPLSVALGLDISGKPVTTDLQKMPHGLIAGATGSGKSVCINSLLISILFKASPDDVKLLLIDPKMVELAPYNQLPHLITPVITDAKEATLGLKWAVEEMERRYELFAHTGVRDMERYNKLVKEKGNPGQKLPYIVVVIDELADLMMVAPNDVEEAICRIAQKARACGIHLLLATQRPSVDVITGLIKANIPTRVAFAVSSQVDSRTIIDTGGAEKLLGKGDMLFLGNGVSKPVRIQGNFVSDDEIERITEHVKRQQSPSYLFEKEELVQANRAVDQDDDLFEEAMEFVLEQGAASSSALQRRFRIGFNRAARLIDMMEAKGLISEAMGSKPRNVLVTKQDYYDRINEDVHQ